MLPFSDEAKLAQARLYFRKPFKKQKTVKINFAEGRAQTNLTNVTFPVPALSSIQQAALRRRGLNPKKVAITMVLVDQPQAVFVLLHFMSVLEEDWIFRVYHSNALVKRFSSRLLQKHLRSGKLILVPLNVQPKDRLTISDFYANRTLWDNLAPATHVLCFQFDSILCAQSKKKVEDFFEYDFIGAPMADKIRAHSRFLMSGGLSLRKRKAMLRVIEKFGPFSGKNTTDLHREDAWFVDTLRQHGGYLPDLQTAAKFATETYAIPEPLGVHRAAHFLAYNGDHPNPQALTLLEEEWCPEMKVLPQDLWYRTPWISGGS